MKVEYGYKCVKCGKIYRGTEDDLPMFCKKCGETLVKKRYKYNLTMDRYGEVVETGDTNMFGGYDYIKTILVDSNVMKVKIRRQCFKWIVMKAWSEQKPEHDSEKIRSVLKRIKKLRELLYSDIYKKCGEEVNAICCWDAEVVLREAEGMLEKYKECVSEL